MNLKRPLYGPQHPLGPSSGRDVKDFVKRTLHRLPAIIPVGADFFPLPPGGVFDDVYNDKVVKAVKIVQRYNDIKPETGNTGQETLDALWIYADAYSRWVYRIWSAPSPIPKLGPVVDGGKAMLDLRLTHPSSGFPNPEHPDSYFPAIDAGWIVGLDVLAVEDMVVTEASSANVGDAFYAMGVSKIEYWYGHIIVAPGVGKIFRRGDKVGDIIVHPNGAHVHMGMNARRLIGHDLTYGYGLGVPTVGAQLREALS
jgi:hypothetical protein